MKKLFAVIITVLTFSTAWSQTEIKINPLGVLFGSPDVSVEFATSPNVGIEPFVGLTFRNFTIAGVNYKSNGFNLGGIGKYYFAPDKGTDKFWAGMYLRGGSSTSEGTANGTTEKVANGRFAVGFGVGYKWVSSHNIVFELGLGIGRAFYNKYTNQSTGTVDVSKYPLVNIDGLGRLQVGYRFGGGDATSSKMKR